MKRTPMEMIMAKRKPETFTAWRVDQPKPKNEESSFDWYEFIEYLLVGFQVAWMSVVGIGCIVFLALVLAHVMGWWALLVPAGLGLFVLGCYRLGKAIVG